MMLEQLQKRIGIEKKDDWSENRTMWDAAQHMTRVRRGRAAVDGLCAILKIRREPVESRTL